jgi:hypothetical protein
MYWQRQVKHYFKMAALMHLHCYLYNIYFIFCFIFRKVDIPTIQYCNLCVHESESKLAATLCPECADFLCTNCNMHHSRSSSSKQHIVISIENYQKLPSHIRSIKNRCTKHGNRYELYCAIHDIACCGMCIRDGHRHCEELLPIHEVTENAKSSTAIAHIERDLKAIDGTFGKIKSNIKKDIFSLHKKKKKFCSIFQTCANHLTNI